MKKIGRDQNTDLSIKDSRYINCELGPRIRFHKLKRLLVERRLQYCMRNLRLACTAHVLQHRWENLNSIIKRGNEVIYFL